MEAISKVARWSSMKLASARRVAVGVEEVVDAAVAAMEVVVAVTEVEVVGGEVTEAAVAVAATVADVAATEGMVGDHRGINNR
jgi:hypothetical protein